MNERNIQNHLTPLMSLQSIAQRLEMGSWSYVSNLLRQKTNIKSANSDD
jgi:hypothetical protein